MLWQAGRVRERIQSAVRDAGLGVRLRGRLERGVKAGLSGGGLNKRTRLGRDG